MDKTLFDVEVGDNVLCENHYGVSWIERVRNVTGSFITIRGNVRYRKRDGWQYGGLSPKTRIRVVPESIVDDMRGAAERAEFLRRVRLVAWETVSTGDIERILKIAEKKKSNERKTKGDGAAESGCKT